jgi:hypothetical protein
LRDYLLSDVHPVGRSKELFFRMLGYSRGDPQRLERDLRELIARSDAAVVGASEYGTKYLVSGRLHLPSGRTPPVLTVWIVWHGETAPRFVTAYPESWP